MDKNLPQSVSSADQRIEQINEVALKDREQMQKVLDEFLQGAVLSKEQPEPPRFEELEHKTGYTLNVFFYDLPELPVRDNFAIIYLECHAAPNGRLFPKTSGFAGRQAVMMTEIMQKYPDVYFYVTSQVNQSSYDNVGKAGPMIHIMKSQPNLIGQNNTWPNINWMVNYMMGLASKFRADFVKDMPESAGKISKNILPKFKAGKLKELQANRSMDLADLAKAEKQINEKSEQ